jgi:hypothetical protein
VAVRHSIRVIRAILAGGFMAAGVSLEASAQRAPTVTLRPANAVLEGEDQQFTAITSIREFSDGRVLVADLRESRVALVDFALNQSTPVGSIGDGPGEYRGVGWLFPLGGDSTLLTDPLARRWIILDGPRMVETVPADHALNRLLGPGLAGTDKHGHILGVVPVRHSTSMPPMRANADSLGVVLASRAGSSGDTVARIRGRGATGLCITVRGDASRRPVPACNRLAAEDLALLFPDGWIAIAMVEPYRVDWRSPEGRWLRGTNLPFDPIRLDDWDKCAFLGAAPSLGMRGSCDPSTSLWPSVLPPFLAYRNPRAAAPLSPSALATPEGNLLIYRAIHPRSDVTTYDLVGRSGKLIGTLKLSKQESVVGFGSDVVYVAEVTELGLQKLRRHPWP